MHDKKVSTKKHIHPKLSKKVKIYFVNSIIMIGIATYETIMTKTNPLLAIGIGCIWILIWLFIARSYQIFWHTKEKIITSRIDSIWRIILWIYTAFSLSKRIIIGFFVPNSSVIAITFALVSGIMIWRFLGTRDTIINILKKQKILN